MKKRKINKAKRVSRQCRNHGQCPYCRSSRLHNANVRKLETDLQIKEYKRGDHVADVNNMLK